MTDQDILEITTILSPLIGKMAWNIHLTDNEALFLSFTEPYEDDNEINPALEANWGFWLTNSAWCIENEQDVLVGSGDETAKIIEMLELLEDQPLQSFEISSPAFEATLTFPHNLILRIFPNTSEKYRHWKILTPELMMLKIGPEDNWSFEKIHKK